MLIDLKQFVKVHNSWKLIGIYICYIYELIICLTIAIVEIQNSDLIFVPVVLRVAWCIYTSLWGFDIIVYAQPLSPCEVKKNLSCGQPARHWIVIQVSLI